MWEKQGVQKKFDVEFDVFNFYRRVLGLNVRVCVYVCACVYVCVQGVSNSAFRCLTSQTCLDFCAMFDTFPSN